MSVDLNEALLQFISKKNLAGKPTLNDCKRKLQKARELGIQIPLIDLLHQEEILSEKQIREFQQKLTEEHNVSEEDLDLLPFEQKYPDLTAPSLLTRTYEQGLISKKEFQETKSIYENLQNLGIPRSPVQILVDRGYLHKQTALDTLTAPDSGNTAEEPSHDPGTELHSKDPGSKSGHIEKQPINQNKPGSSEARTNTEEPFESRGQTPQTSSSNSYFSSSQLLQGVSILSGGLLAFVLIFYVFDGPSETQAPRQSSASTTSPEKTAGTSSNKKHPSIKTLRNFGEKLRKSTSSDETRKIIQELNELEEDIPSDLKHFWKRELQKGVRTWFNQKMASIESINTSKAPRTFLSTYRESKKRVNDIENTFLSPSSKWKNVFSNTRELKNELKNQLKTRKRLLKLQKENGIHNSLRTLEQRMEKVLDTIKNPETVRSEIDEKIKNYLTQLEVLPVHDKDRTFARNQLQDFRSRIENLLSKQNQRSDRTAGSDSPSNRNNKASGTADGKSPEKTERTRNKEVNSDHLNVSRENKITLTREDLNQYRSGNRDWDLHKNSARTLAESNPPIIITDNFLIVSPLSREVGKEIAAIAEAITDLLRRTFPASMLKGSLLQNPNKRFHLHIHPRTSDLKQRKSRLSRKYGLEFIGNNPPYISTTAQIQLLSLFQKDSIRRHLQMMISRMVLMEQFGTSAPWWIANGLPSYFYSADFPPDSSKLYGGSLNSKRAKRYLTTAKRALIKEDFDLNTIFNEYKTITGKKQSKGLRNAFAWGIVQFFLHSPRSCERKSFQKFLTVLSKSNQEGKSPKQQMKNIIDNRTDSSCKFTRLDAHWKSYTRNLISSWKPWKTTRTGETYRRSNHLQQLKNLGRKVLSGKKDLSINKPGSVTGNRTLKNPWTYETMHYKIRTTISKEALKEVAFVMELMNYNFRKLFGMKDRYMPKMDVIIPKNKKQYKKVRGRSPDSKVHTGGYFNWVKEELVVYYQHESDYRKTGRILLHEGTHLFLYVLSKTEIPNWLDEGLAEYMLATNFKSYTDLELGRTDLMRDFLNRLQKEIPEGNLKKARSELTRILKPNQQLKRRGYVLAWSFIHFLLHRNQRSRSRFIEYVQSFFDSATKPDVSIDYFQEYFSNLNTLTEHWVTYLHSL